MPSSLRREMGLCPGQPLLWKRVSDREVLVTVPGRGQVGSMRGFMKKFHRLAMPSTTAEWLKLLREGEGR